MNQHETGIERVSVFEPELEMFAEILRRDGRVVLTREEAMNLQEGQAQILAGVQAISEQLGALPAPASAADIAAGVVADLPDLGALAADVAAMKSGIDGLVAGEPVTADALSKLQTTVDGIAAVVGPPPV